MISRPGNRLGPASERGECANPLFARTIGDVILGRLSRREAPRGLTAVAALASLPNLASIPQAATSVRLGRTPYRL